MPTLKERTDKLLVDCGHAINANNGRCTIIEEALCETTTLVIDLEKSNADLLAYAECEAALEEYERACMAYPFSEPTVEGVALLEFLLPHIPALIDSRPRTKHEIRWHISQLRASVITRAKGPTT